jgi:YidC/Oxa1 family membrane protein insertase
VTLPTKAVRVDYQPVTVASDPAAEAPPATLVAYDARFPAPPVDVRFFFGPKDFDVLRAVDQELVRVINYGIFSFLAVPLLRALKGINAYVGNYGWSIIILTFLINAAMFPLRHKSVVSMRRMQEIQPEIKAIQERYGKLKATDPERQKMNTEMMALYKTKGVNPASGCVPMLLTIPVLFAFYALLSQAIEIRGAPFGLWIKDLSVHDTLYVTPILMGVTMVWQQKITPSSADPMQQKMMMAMPLVFTFMFLWAPSGLVIYWFVSNIMAIAQQYITNQIVGPPKVALARPPAERRLKSAGAGKSNGAKGSGA